MRLPELKALARDRGLRRYSRMRKAELIAFLKNSGRAAASRTRSPTPPPQMCVACVTLKFDDKGSCRIHGVSKGDEEIVTNERYFVMPWKMVNVDGKVVSLKEVADEVFSKQDELTNSMYVTLKLYEKGSCRIHSVSDDGNKEIVPNEKYVVMPWKVVNRRGENGENNKHVTLAEAVHEIIRYKESVDREQERREAEREEIEKKRAEYFEAHMKSETERLKNLVDWYGVRLNEIREAPVDSRLRMLRRLYRISERNKNWGVTITSAGVLNPVNYSVYPPELKIPEYEDPKDFVNPFCDVRGPNDPVYKEYNQVDYFKKDVRYYRGRDDDSAKYVKKVKLLIDCSQLDDLKLEVRIAMAKVKCPRKLDISVFHQLTGRLTHEDLNYDDEKILMHFYNTFYNESIKLLEKMVRCRTNVLYHLLDKIGKEPNVDHFQFMKGPAYQ